MSATSSSATQPAGTRRRQRPYLNWLQRSRDKWKAKAVQAKAEATRLDRRVASLINSRDRWRAETLQLKSQLRLAQSDLEENVSRS